MARCSASLLFLFGTDAICGGIPDDCRPMCFKEPGAALTNVAVQCLASAPRWAQLTKYRAACDADRALTGFAAGPREIFQQAAASGDPHQPEYAPPEALRLRVESRQRQRVVQPGQRLMHDGARGSE